MAIRAADENGEARGGFKKKKKNASLFFFFYFFAKGSQKMKNTDMSGEKIKNK